MRLVRFGSLLLVVAVSVVVGGCGSDGISADDLDQAVARWGADEPAAYHWRADGFVDDQSVDISMIIVGGEAESISGSGLGLDFAPDGLFAQIDAALRAGTEVRGSFDSEAGYPKRVVIGDAVDLTTRDFIPIPRPAGCPSEPGSATDLASERAEAWLYGEYARWFDESGCEVRIDVIRQHDGPTHCGWESATFITIGSPIGERVEADGVDSGGARTYIWDPEGVLVYIDGIERDVSLPIEDLPDTASDTGFSAGEAELWLDSADATTLYRVQDGVADQFVLDEPRQIVCE